MGQYHLILNLDKRQFIHPHNFTTDPEGFGHGLKLMEFGCDKTGPMTAVACLLAEQNRDQARGGGDLHPWNGGPGYEGRETPSIPHAEQERLMHMVGSWAGDRIIIMGDYYTDDDPIASTIKDNNPWNERDSWTDISVDAAKMIELDYYVWSSRNNARKSEV